VNPYDHNVSSRDLQFMRTPSVLFQPAHRRHQFSDSDPGQRLQMPCNLQATPYQNLHAAAQFSAWQAAVVRPSPADAVRACKVASHRSAARQAPRGAASGRLIAGLLCPTLPRRRSVRTSLGSMLMVVLNAERLPARPDDAEISADARAPQPIQ
jgi:hypothetical protein